MEWSDLQARFYLRNSTHNDIHDLDAYLVEEEVKIGNIHDSEPKEQGDE